MSDGWREKLARFERDFAEECSPRDRRCEATDREGRRCDLVDGHEDTHLIETHTVLDGNGDPHGWGWNEWDTGQETTPGTAGPPPK